MKLFLTSLILATVAAETPLVTHHAPERYFGDWATVQRAPGSHAVSFTIVVKEQNMDVVRQLALEISDPDSPKYGHYFNQEQLDALTKPDQADFDRVFGWLKSNGIQYTSKHSNVVVSCTVAQAEKLLGAEFSIMASEAEGAKIVRAGDYKLPVSVEFSVATIFGLHGIPKPTEKPVVSAQAGVAQVTPKVIATTYKVSGTNVSRSLTTRQAVAEFQGQLMSQADLSTFFTKYVSGAQSGDDQVYKYVGDKKETGEGVEALLDIQFIMGVVPGVKTEFWEWKGNNFCADLNGWTTEILSETDGPKVHSVSYGWQGQLSQLGCQASDISTVEDNLAKIATTGVSIIFASGDSGSAYTGGILGGHMYPSWPASSPWVTAVGATRFVNQQPGQAEMATDQFGSGGGFSANFAQSPNAEWQSAAVKNYLATATGLPDASLYNASGRATPDISALGEGYTVVVGGRTELVGGTSASTPAFAGLVSVINDARAQAGKKSLGFLNPFLYKNADAFTDVTQGSNKIGRGGNELKEGWECAKGWDPATGLGTPIFPKLLAAAMALP